MQDEQYISSPTMRSLVGGISEVTEWRWAQDDALLFPKPVRINNRKYYKKSEIVAWLDAMRGDE